MKAAEFWKLVDKTRDAADGDPRKQSELLTEELAKLPESEIISFDQIFDDLKDKAYIGNLWDAATVIMSACSDSGFEVFREWLIGRGKEAYENALKDPDTLVDVLEAGEQTYPTLLGPGMDAYERVTGKDMPPMPRPSAQLQGRPTINIDADDAELLAEISARFPKLTAKFWQWWTRDKIYLEIRDILRKVLVPLSFSEREIKSLGIAEFQRGHFSVEIRLEDVDLYYALFFSRELRSDGYPKRQIVMSFVADEYNEAKKNEIEEAIQQWLESIKL